MLREGYGVKKVVLAAGYTDLRLGMDGLITLIMAHYGMDPVEEGTLFLFCGKRCDRILALLFEGDGFCLMKKRLTDGRFRWPRNTTDALTLDINDFHRLMEGLRVTSTVRTPRRDVRQRK